MTGFAEFWAQGDAITRSVAALLLLMSVSAWVVILWKAWLLRRVRRDLNPKIALIGFCGAPWTVATYMVAGQGTPDQAPARMMARSSSSP